MTCRACWLLVRCGSFDVTLVWPVRSVCGLDHAQEGGGARVTCVAWTMQRKRRRGTCDLWGLCTPVPFGWFRPARWRWERPGQCACMLAPWRAGRCAAGSAAAHGCRGSREWPAWMGPAGIRGCVFASMSCLYWQVHKRQDPLAQAWGVTLGGGVWPTAEGRTDPSASVCL